MAGKTGKIIRLHKAVDLAMQARWDERPIEKTMQADTLDYYELLSNALKRVRLDELELKYLHWLFGFKQVRPEERSRLHRVVERLAYAYPWQGTTKPTDFAAKLAAYSETESLAISDAMERAIAHPSYAYDKPAMYRAVGLLPPLADDPYSRPAAPAVPTVISSEVLKTSDTWTWPAGSEFWVTAIRSLNLSKAELRTVDEKLVDEEWFECERLFAADPFLAGVSGRMMAQYRTLGYWSALIDAVRKVRSHPEYATDPVAAYRAAGLCA